MSGHQSTPRRVSTAPDYLPCMHIAAVAAPEGSDRNAPRLEQACSAVPRNKGLGIARHRAASIEPSGHEFARHSHHAASPCPEPLRSPNSAVAPSQCRLSRRNDDRPLRMFVSSASPAGDCQPATVRATRERMKNTVTWPTMIPDDLRYRRHEVLGGISRPLAADVWTDLREWLIAHDVTPPDELARPRSSYAARGQLISATVPPASPPPELLPHRRTSVRPRRRRSGCARNWPTMACDRSACPSG